MATLVFRGHPKFGIPRGSTVRIYALPDHILVYENKDAADQVSCEADPGAYCAMVWKALRGGRIFKYIEKQIYHRISKQAFDTLRMWSPERAKTRMVSDGSGAKLICGYAGCRYSTPSKTHMIVHEGKHRGVDILKEMELAAPAPPPINTEEEETFMARTRRARRIIPDLDSLRNYDFTEDAKPDLQTAPLPEKLVLPPPRVEAVAPPSTFTPMRETPEPPAPEPFEEDK